MTTKADSQKIHSRLLLREALICLAAFCLPALILYPYIPMRLDAEFHAAIRTRELKFTIGEGGYTGSGIFAARRNDVVFEHFDRAEMPSGKEVKGARVSFRNIRLQSVPLVEGTQVLLLWEPSKPTGISISADYGKTPTSPVTIFWDRDSQAECDTGPLVSVVDGNANIYPLQDRALNISLDPHFESSKKDVALVFDITRVQIR